MSNLPEELREKIEKSLAGDGMQIKYADGFEKSAKRLFSMNPYYAIPRWYRDSVRMVKMAWQRVVRGWDDDSAWNYYAAHAREVVAKLRFLAKNHSGCPNGLCQNPGYHFCEITAKKGEKCEWQEILEQIAEGFTAEQKLNDLTYMEGTNDKEVWTQRALALEVVADRGWELYRKHYRSLWD